MDQCRSGLALSPDAKKHWIKSQVKWSVGGARLLGGVRFYPERCVVVGFSCSVEKS